MLFLKINYNIKVSDNIVLIKDCTIDDIVFAFKVKKVNLDKLINKLYYGFESKDNTTTEDRLLNKIYNKEPKLFSEYSDKTDIESYGYFRNINEIIYKSFISKQDYEYFINRLEEYIREKEVNEVYLDLDEKFNILYEKIERIPFIKISRNKNSSIGIVSNNRFKENDNINCNNVLLINIDGDFIEIGPLIHTYKFKIPQINFEENFNKTTLMQNEIDLISFFLEKVIFFTIFNLLDKTRENHYIPNRFKLRFNRINLMLETEDIKLIPKNLN